MNPDIITATISHPIIETPTDCAALFFIAFFILYGIGGLLDWFSTTSRPTTLDE